MSTHARFSHDHSGGLDPTGKITPALVHSIGQNALDIAINAATTEGPEDPLFWAESAGNIAALVNDAATIAIGHPVIPQGIVTGLMDIGTAVGVTTAGSDVFDAAQGVLNGSGSLADLATEVTKAIPTLVALSPTIPATVKSFVNASFEPVSKNITDLLSTLKL